MSDISNTLRQRLGARPAPQTHPEADLLAAYLERSLPAVEREPITVHLAIWAECREVVSLSLAPEPELSVVRQLNPRRRLWLLGLRGAALAACLTIVTVLAIKAPWNACQSESICKGPARAKHYRQRGFFFPTGADKLG